MAILTEEEIDNVERVMRSQMGPTSMYLMAVVPRLIATVRQLREALPDPEKMEMLADWFDCDDNERGDYSSTEVQDDLRKWAAQARKALGEQP